MEAIASKAEASMEEPRPTLLEGPGKRADVNPEPDIPKLRFAYDPANEIGDCSKPLGGSCSTRSGSGSCVTAEDLRPSECLRLQRVADHYQMGKQIGQGGYGKVFKVQCIKTRKSFALKEVVVPDGKSVDDVESEVTNSSEFDHPHILKLHAFFGDGRIYHLVFDLCEGGNLAEYVEQYGQACRQFVPKFGSGLPGRTVMKMVPQMMSGMLYLHHHRFVHRDIKPHNYMRVHKCDDSSPLKLCDFGMCVRLQPGDELSKCCGTRGFMAPEVKCGFYDQKADVFSLGITIFAVCTDAVPQDEPNQAAYSLNLQAALAEACQWQKENPQLSALVRRMLAIYPACRPTVKELMADTDWITKAPRKKQQTCSAPCVVM